jgi:TRAP-type C4-dicarboxylate transport system permease small subunit
MTTTTRKITTYLLITGFACLLAFAGCSTVERQWARETAYETTQQVPLTPETVTNPTSLAGWAALWAAVFSASLARKLITNRFGKPGEPPIGTPLP